MEPSYSILLPAVKYPCFTMQTDLIFQCIGRCTCCLSICSFIHCSLAYLSIVQPSSGEGFCSLLVSALPLSLALVNQGFCTFRLCMLTIVSITFLNIDLKVSHCWLMPPSQSSLYCSLINRTGSLFSQCTAFFSVDLYCTVFPNLGTFFKSEHFFFWYSANFITLELQSLAGKVFVFTGTCILFCKHIVPATWTASLNLENSRCVL